MNIGIIINTKDPEISWNAVRVGIFCQNRGDKASIFLMNSGVEAEYIENEKFDTVGKLSEFIENGGELLSCSSCLKVRNIDIPRFSQKANLANLYEIISKSDRLMTF